MSLYNSVLIVDDDPTQIAILSAYFGSLRVGTILHAEDGRKALSIVSGHTKSIDLVVSDLSMPNMDGIEFLRHLKDVGYKGKIVLISSFNDMLIDNAARLGEMHGLQIAGRIRKPLTKGALDKTFANSISQKKPGVAEVQNTLGKSELEIGLARHEFLPFYQPKVDILTGAVCGAEALARWQSAERGLLCPSMFIQAAEKHRLIEQITFQIFAKVIEDIKTNTPDWDDIKISVNLSPAMLSDITLPDRLQALLDSHNISSSVFCLEVTETGILEFDPKTIEVLSRLRLAGFELAVDDFGTGASNISNLRMFPYSELKIDQSFINNIMTDAFSAETVRTSISLARQLDMRIVAEGVESQEIFDLVKSKGIDQAQGYFIAQPLPAGEIDMFFKNRHSWLADKGAGQAPAELVAKVA